MKPSPATGEQHGPELRTSVGSYQRFCAPVRTVKIPRYSVESSSWPDPANK